LRQLDAARQLHRLIREQGDLSRHGDAQGAKAYYTKCIIPTYNRKWTQTLAYIELRKLGVEPMDVETAMIKKLAETTPPATRPAE
jgi:hypothetical protein